MENKERVDNVIRMINRATANVVPADNPKHDGYWQAVIDITDALAEFWQKRDICPEYGIDRILALIAYLESRQEAVNETNKNHERINASDDINRSNGD